MGNEYGSYPGDLVAGCRVNGNNGEIFGKSLRIADTLRTAPGQYQITLSAGGVDASTACVSVCPSGATSPVSFSVLQASDTVFNVSFAQGDPLEPVAVDTSFWFEVKRLS